MRYVVLFLALAATALGQTTLPRSLIFVGASAEPNGGLASAAADVGAAKLTGDSTYMGVVAHLASKGVVPFQLSTKIQFHVAQRVGAFRSWPVFWTGEVGPDFSATTPVAGLSVGYAMGSGPLISVPIAMGISIAFHAEAIKGSLQDLTWRGGLLIVFRSE